MGSICKCVHAQHGGRKFDVIYHPFVFLSFFSTFADEVPADDSRDMA